MDERPLAIHRFAARCACPDRAAPRSVNPLRGFSSPALPANKNAAPRGGIVVGGGGGNG